MTILLVMHPNYSDRLTTIIVYFDALKFKYTKTYIFTLNLLGKDLFYASYAQTAMYLTIKA